MNDAGRPGEHAHHSPSQETNAHYLAIALFLILAFLAVEVTVAFLSNSLALISDAGHMLTDAFALASSLWAARLAERPARGAWTFGFKRAEILSAAGNGITLLVVSAAVIYESIHRLLSPSHVDGISIAMVALAGIAVNFVVAKVLMRADRSSLNVEGSFRHIVTDLYGFLATLVAGIVIATTHFERADAIASLLVVALMLQASRRLLTASGRILLEGAPENIDLAEVRAHLLEVEHVIDVHDVHAWTVTSDLPTLSAHVVIEESCFADGCAPQIVDQLQACLLGHFDVEHCTFQLEPIGHRDHETGTH